MKMFGLKILVGTLFFIMVTGGGLITSLDAQGAVTGETSMTVVNVDNWQTPDKSNWYAERVYINHVDIVGYQHIAWSMTPYPLPWARFPNTVAGVLSSVWTNNGGKTWSSLAWDYIGVTTTGKHQEGQTPGNLQWVGIFISTLCDHNPGECNGRERSNLYFTTETF